MNELSIEIREDNPSQSVLENLRKINRLRSMSNVAFGHLLYEANEKGYYKDWTYQENGETKAYTSVYQAAMIEFSYDTSSIRTFMRVYETFILDLKIPQERINEISWAKLKMLLPRVDETNVEDWLEKAENNSQNDLRDNINESQSGDQMEYQDLDDNPKWAKLNFVASEEQAEVIRLAMRLAKDHQELEKEAAQLEYIAASYLLASPEDNKLQALEKYIAIVENIFGVNLEVVSTRT